MKNKSYCAFVPSNIAFLKYWGKSNENLKWPTNNSLSMTLDQCRTTTLCEINFDLKDFEIYHDGILLKQGSFFSKTKCHLEFLKKRGDFKEFLRVETSNNFPTASGIASSASGFAALTLASMAAWTDSNSFDELEKNNLTKENLSSLSRFGSGSSCRSFWGDFVLWEKGSSPDEQKTRPLPYQWKLSDTIVIFDSLEKKLSSSEAHSRVQTSPFFSLRLCEMEKRQNRFEQALKNKDIEALGELLELEALDIHSVIMTSEKPFSYLTKQTIDFLTWFRIKRKEKAFKAYFTIDAGPNVHVISEPLERDSFLFHLKKDFPTLKIICDQTGSGPTLFPSFSGGSK